MATVQAPRPTGTGSGAGARRHRLAAPGGVAAAALAGFAALAARDPHQAGAWGFCPLQVGLGVDCPLCGGLRAAHDLTQGDLAAALSSHLVLVAALPLLVAVWAVWLASRWRGRPLPGTARTRSVAGIALAGVLLAFGVLRNLPGLEWLAS